MEEITKSRAAYICVKDTLDGAYPALVMALNSVRQGMETKIFYSFAGLGLVTEGGAERAKFYPPGPLGAIPGMSNITTGLFKKKIDKADIPSLAELQEMAQLEGVQLIACHMAVSIMELDESKLIDGVEVWPADKFLTYARTCEICLYT